LQKGLRVAQVLDQVTAQHDVEGRFVERERHRLDVTDDHVLAHLASRLRRLGV
jgi:hypothetical protein